MKRFIISICWDSINELLHHIMYIELYAERLYRRPEIPLTKGYVAELSAYLIYFNDVYTSKHNYITTMTY